MTTTLGEIQLQCPLCGSRFRCDTVISTDSFGGRRTDFHELSSGIQPLPFLVYVCYKCSYTGMKHAFAEDTEITSTTRERVSDGVVVIKNRKDLPGSEKYELAAKIAEWQEVQTRYIADLLLKAAWCCVEENDLEAERFFRRKAARMYEQAIKKWDGVKSQDRAVLSYLVGELWRRIGDKQQAEVWFDRVPEEVVYLESQQWVVDLAHQQQHSPKELFDRNPPFRI